MLNWIKELFAVFEPPALVIAREAMLSSKRVAAAAAEQQCLSESIAVMQDGEKVRFQWYIGPAFFYSPRYATPRRPMVSVPKIKRAKEKAT